LGLPFDSGTSAGYRPLSGADFKDTLYDFKTRTKEDRLVQLADLCLWPICLGGYNPDNVPYRAMREAGTLLDSRLSPDVREREGIKYSCFELHRQTASQG
jgi:hypothetical protein